ncbi:hypothetical protein WDW89_13010 [Deltaproteobacteria bacterium TL4]
MIGLSLRLLVLGFVLYGGYQIVRLLKKSPFLQEKGTSKDVDVARKEELMIEDPQCHVFVPISSAFVKIIHGTKTCFCSEDCANKYLHHQ